MDDPFERFRRPKPNPWLQLLEKQPEPKPEQPDWWKSLTEQRTRTRPAFPGVLLEPPYVYPFANIDEARKQAVWLRGAIIEGQDPAVMRRDSYGSIMLYCFHGNCSSEYGWEIDHIIPRAANGSEALWNLQPLQWQNNRRKGDTFKPPTPQRRPLSL
jgi:hypothetical protein